MKQILSEYELVEHMKEKGIKFSIIKENEATNFLKHRNYYFKLAAYRCLYPKVNSGQRRGQYQNLDFANLVELSIIDMHIRYLIMEMSLDIEHAIKVRLVDSVTSNQNEDGYEIFRRYLSQEDENFYILKQIKRHKSGEYCKNLISKYYPFFPIWVLVELISFGDLLHVCYFYEKQYNCHIIPGNKLMNNVRDLRNAAAHSNCLLNQINHLMDSSKQPSSIITNFVKNMDIVSSSCRSKNLHRNFLYDVVTLLYVYDKLMPKVSKCKRFEQLVQFLHGRAQRHVDYFSSNTKIVGAYDFLTKVIDKLNSKY